MHILIFSQHLLEIVYATLKILSLISILSVNVSAASLILDFLLDILLVKSYSSSFEFFEIMHTMQTFKYIIFKALFEKVLGVYLYA